MFSVSQHDVLQSLKRFRRLAKQDLITSEHTDDPKFWTTLAEARRAAYGRMMRRVEKDGVEAAYESALTAYTELPLVTYEDKEPAITGAEQAHEMFFTILGVGAKAMARLRNTRRRRRINRWRNRNSSPNAWPPDAHDGRRKIDSETVAEFGS